jgi:hypothetical protein
MTKTYKTVGIYGVSTQSGMAYFADFLSRGLNVRGYARPSEHGKLIIQALNDRKGIYLERPINQNVEPSRFIPLGHNIVDHDLAAMIRDSDIILLPIPAHYHQAAVEDLCGAGLAQKRTPLLLSPSRTFATPYLWKALGDGYPVVCFSTSPYSCKTLGADTVFIKRRKRTFLASLEGNFSEGARESLHQLFPQVALCNVPALTSLNNIGAVFHPTPYLMNLEQINRSAALGVPFSFYVDGICRRPDVARELTEIDQTRLAVAERLGMNVFGLEQRPREVSWTKLTLGLRMLENEHEDDIDELREIRRKFLECVNNCVISAQHWLDLTYGVERKAGEPLADAIARTPTYQKLSYPQLRYVEEDIPTGLVPLEALAKLYALPHAAITRTIDTFSAMRGEDARQRGRNLSAFSGEYIEGYLKGRLCACGTDEPRSVVESRLQRPAPEKHRLCQVEHRPKTE